MLLFSLLLKEWLCESVLVKCNVISEIDPIHRHPSIGHRTRTFSYTRESTGECSFRLSNRASVPYGAFSWQLGHASLLDERNHSSRHALQNTCLFAHNVTTGDSAKSAHILHVNSSTLSESTRLNGNPDPLPLRAPSSVSMTTTE